MDKQFESFLDDLAGALKKAAACAVWDIPATHRTKDSISAYRASLVMVSHVVTEVAAKHRAPAVQIESATNEMGFGVAESQPEHNASTTVAPVDDTVGPGEPTADPVAQLLATDPERLFDADADKPRRRRSHGA